MLASAIDQYIAMDLNMNMNKENIVQDKVQLAGSLFAVFVFCFCSLVLIRNYEEGTDFQKLFDINSFGVCSAAALTSTAGTFLTSIILAISAMYDCTKSTKKHSQANASGMHCIFDENKVTDTSDLNEVLIKSATPDNISMSGSTSVPR